MKKNIIILFLLVCTPALYSSDTVDSGGGGSNSSNIDPVGTISYVSPTDNVTNFSNSSKPSFTDVQITDTGLNDAVRILADAIHQPTTPMSVTSICLNGGSYLVVPAITEIGKGIGGHIGTAIAAALIEKTGIKTQFQIETENWDFKYKKALAELQAMQVEQGKEVALFNAIKSEVELDNELSKLMGIREKDCKLYESQYPERAQELNKAYMVDFDKLKALKDYRKEQIVVSVNLLEYQREARLKRDYYKINRDPAGVKFALDHFGRPSVDIHGNPVRYHSKNEQRLVDEDGNPITEDGKPCPVDADGKLLVDEKGKLLKKEPVDKNVQEKGNYQPSA